MEVSDVRRRLRSVLDATRKQTAERRARIDEAARAYEAFLPGVAVPAFQMMAQALSAEGHRFKVFTPGEAVRLVPEFSQEDFIELSLDTAGEWPVAMVRTSHGRGRRNVSSERPPFGRRPFPEVSEDDVVAMLLEEIVPFVER